MLSFFIPKYAIKAAGAGSLYTKVCRKTAGGRGGIILN